MFEAFFDLSSDLFMCRDQAVRLVREDTRDPLDQQERRDPTVSIVDSRRDEIIYFLCVQCDNVYYAHRYLELSVNGICQCEKTDDRRCFL